MFSEIAESQFFSLGCGDGDQQGFPRTTDATRHDTTPHAARMLPDSSLPVSIASSSPVILMIGDSKTADGGLNVLYKD